jgi:aquaporin Z
MTKKLGVEFLGTFWLMLIGLGAGMLAGPALGGETLGPVAVALAFGLAVAVAGYAMGHVSGGHFNPVVTLGVAAAGRMDSANAIPYMIAQVAGGILGLLMLRFILAGAGEAGAMPAQMAPNGYAAASPGGYSMAAAFLTELVLGFLFVMLVLGATTRRAAAGFAPLAIGLGYALIFLVSLPVTNGSVNPARSTASAVFSGAEAAGQLWLFWIAPLIGAALAGLANRFSEE